MVEKAKALTNLKIVVERERVMKRLSGSRINSPSSLPLLNLVEKELEVCYALIEPKASYVNLKVELAGGDSSRLGDDFVLKSRSLARLLSDCSYATIFVASIGGELEAEVERRFKQGDKSGGLVLDTVGSEAAESLARRMQVIIVERAKREGFSATARFSPGYGDLHLCAQEPILELTKASHIGVSLTESFMLVPRKSVSAIIGWRKG